MALDVLEINQQLGDGDLLQQSQPERKADVADEVAEPPVDTFLKEAVNSRNRLTVLRLEQEIERFARNANQQDLLLKPLQSSYERLAAHRIALYYGLQSMVVTAVFPKVSRILLVKTVETRLPPVRLADIPVESGLADKVAPATNEKIAIKQRVSKVSDIEGSNGSNEIGRTPLKTVEEREEEYDKARARIFNSSEAANADNGESGISFSVEQQNFTARLPSSSGLISPTEGISQLANSNRVAILRDKEKDMKDPDYDRSYRRYPQLLDPNASLICPRLRRVYPPTGFYDKYSCIDGHWAHQLQLEQLNCMLALPFRGPRVECYSDNTYLNYGQSHQNPYWHCPALPPHPQNAHFNLVKDGFSLSFQHGLQSAMSLGPLDR